MAVIEYENLGKVNQPFFDAYRKAFDTVLKSGWYILGNAVKDFEQQYASYCETSHCIGVANGLDALILSLKAFGFEGVAAPISSADVRQHLFSRFLRS